MRETSDFLFIMTTQTKYNILISLLSSVARLPLRALYVLSDVAYFFIYHVVRYRRKTVRSNLVMVFGDSDMKMIVRTEKEFYRHLCDCIAETVKLLHISDEEIDRRVDVTNGEYIDSIIRSLPPVGYLPHFTDSIGILSMDSLGGIHIVTDSVLVLEDTMKYILNDHLNDLL